jgi:hypothetical protein
MSPLLSRRKKTRLEEGLSRNELELWLRLRQNYAATALKLENKNMSKGFNDQRFSEINS